MQMSDRWTKDQILTDVPEHRPLRRGHVRLRGRGAALLRQALQEAQPWQAARSPAFRRSRRSTTRCDNRRRRKQRRETTCSTRCCRRATITPAAARRRRGHRLGLRRQAVHPRPPALLRLVRARRAAASARPARRVRKGGLAGDTPRSTRGCRAAPRRRSPTRSTSTDAPAAAHGRDRPAHRRGAGDAVVVPTTARASSTCPSHAKRQAGSTFKAYALAAMVDSQASTRTTAVRDVPARELPAHPGRHGTRRAVDGGQRRRRRAATVLPLDSRRSSSRTTRSSPGSRSTSAPTTSPTWPTSSASRRRINLPAGPSVILGVGRRLAAVHDPRLLDARRTTASAGRCSRSPRCTSTDRQGAREEKPGQGQARDPRRRHVRVTDSARPNVHTGTGLKHQTSRRTTASGRQDRHDRRPHGRLVLRLHAQRWPPACGSATRRARSRWTSAADLRRPAFGGDYPATIWTKFASAAFQRHEPDEVPADSVAAAQNPCSGSRSPRSSRPTCAPDLRRGPSRRRPRPCSPPTSTGPRAAAERRRAAGMAAG